MRHLILVRHGKSSWDYRVEDRDRPLKEIGIQDAHRVSHHFNSWKIKVNAVYSSPAIRALHTCVIFLRNLKIPYSNFSLTDDLYDFSGEDVLQFVRNLPDSQQIVMIFGHNHAFTEVANIFGDIYIDNVPTTGLVHLSFKVPKWKDVQKGKTEKVVLPKDLRI
ncbi:SixA phosphatase family protein [Muriicola sp.]|uniref:SixA phosphatase family protein n=1 Tax=Muriicola sp. TaxID=2020856 RepID=UPI003C758ED3